MDGTWGARDHIIIRILHAGSKAPVDPIGSSGLIWSFGPRSGPGSILLGAPVLQELGDDYKGFEKKILISVT